MEDIVIFISCPVHKREYELDFEYKPGNKSEFIDFIKSAPRNILEGVGIREWDTYEGNIVHYLFPGEWYSIIPDNFKCLTIGKRVEFFKKGKSDNDTRYGCLPYGFLRKE
jgi:hypothetical protein